MDTNMHTHIYHITQSGKEGGRGAGDLLVPSSCAFAPAPAHHRLRKVPGLPRRALLPPKYIHECMHVCVCVCFFFLGMCVCLGMCLGVYANVLL